MRIPLLLFVLLFIPLASFGQETRTYYNGPKGGCYYINKNGNKTYVDHSFCNRKSEGVAVKVAEVEADSSSRVMPLMSGEKQSTQTTQRTYYRGPRGGCYYVSASGNKVYVDRSVCDR